MSEDLMLIPGLASDALLWQRTIDSLGSSAACIVGDTLRDADLSDMAKRVLDQPPRRFSLAGVSMGGIVALEIMTIAPSRIRRLALIDAIAAPDTAAQRLGRSFAGVAAGSKTLFRTMIRRSVGTMVHPGASPDTVDAIVAMSLRLGPAVFARQTRAIAARRDLRPFLAAITAPTAVIVGSHDTKTPLKHSRELADRIGGATLDVLPNCGHLAPIEQPVRLAGILASWLHRPAATTPREC